MKPQLLRNSESALRAQSRKHSAWRARTTSPITRDRRFAAAAAFFVWVAAYGADSPAAVNFVPGRLLVKFRDVPRPDVDQVLASVQAGEAAEIPGIGVKIIELPPQADERAALRVFRLRPEVEFVELDRLVPPDAIPNDPLYNYYANDWYLPRIAAPSAWDSTTGIETVIIAVLSRSDLS